MRLVSEIALSGRGISMWLTVADDKIRVNWDLATDCDEATASLCPTDALYMFGKEMTVDEVIDEVAKDASFYRSNTGGGITLSGGECLLQPDFSAALLEEAHNNGFNTAIETAWQCSLELLSKKCCHTWIPCCMTSR